MVQISPDQLNLFFWFVWKERVKKHFPEWFRLSNLINDSEADCLNPLKVSFHVFFSFILKSLVVVSSMNECHVNFYL